MGDIKDALDLILGLLKRTKDRQHAAELLDIQVMVAGLYREQAELHQQGFDLQAHNAQLKARVAALEARVLELEPARAEAEHLRAEVKALREFLGPMLPPEL